MMPRNLLILKDRAADLGKARLFPVNLMNEPAMQYLCLAYAQNNHPASLKKYGENAKTFIVIIVHL